MTEQTVVQFGVFKDANSRTCIKVQHGRVWTRFIAMDAAGLRVQKLDNVAFSRRFHTLDTPLDRACNQYLGAQHIPMTDAAREILQKLIAFERKRQMAKMKFHVISSKGEHAGIATGEDDLNTMLAAAGEGSKGVQSAPELGTLSIAALTTLLNQFSDKAIKKLSDKTEKTLARVWSALPPLPVEEPAAPEPAPEAEEDSQTEDSEEEGMATAKKAAKRGARVTARPSKAERHTNGNGATGPREGTKADKMLKALVKAGATGATLEQLMKATDFDAANAKAQIGNMRSGRVGGGTKYNIEHDKARGRYTLRA